MARARRPLSSVKLRVRVQFDTQALDATIEALDHLIATPALVAQLLRNAVAETLLVAFRTRFLEQFETLLSPERVAGSTALVESPGARKAKASLVKAYTDLAAADAQGSKAGAKAARQRLLKAQQRLVKYSERLGGGSVLATGHYRELALAVLRTLTDASLVKVSTSGGQVQVGIGNMGSLDAIETPSATPMLTGHVTASTMTSMWRQLEFGTGIYSTLPGVTHTGWTYGPRPGFGLELLGARGAHAVFDAATGVPYHKDSLNFEQLFAGLLGRALSGA